MLAITSDSTFPMVDLWLIGVARRAKDKFVIGKSSQPREEIVVMCPTTPGHGGAPAVNSSGAVVGILSRADPVDPHRCYLVPSSELKILVNKARKTSSRVGGPKLPY
jgi:hypothetical protein